jgi:membrane protease YdiL (CAAX protease family)
MSNDRNEQPDSLAAPILARAALLGHLPNEFLGFASRGRNAWWRYLISCVAAFLLAILLLSAVSLALTALHLLPPEFAAELAQPQHASVFFLGVGAVFGALAVGLMASAALFQHKRPGDIIGRWRWSLFFWGFGVWAALQCALALIDFLIAPSGFSVTASRTIGSSVISALIGISIQTFAEEFIFRGYLTQGILLVTKRTLPAAIISGLLFGSMHIPNGIPQALNAVVFGIVCALITIRIGGICLTFGLHLANNLFGAVVLVSTSDVFKSSPGLFTQDTPQLLWSDVGLAIVAMLGFLWLVMRNSALGFPTNTGLSEPSPQVVPRG